MTELVVPAEWSENAACWLAWPSDPDEWAGDLASPRRELAALCRAIADPDPATGRPRGERVELLVPDAAGEAEARAALGEASAAVGDPRAALGEASTAVGDPRAASGPEPAFRYWQMPYGDIWLRDTGPIFGLRDGALCGVRFGWDGWGGKYPIPGDAEVGARIVRAVGAALVRHPLVLEGGAVELDGEGTALTTRQCALDPTRNPRVTERTVELALRDALGVRRVVWLDRGLANDHTDGHVDTLARFVAPGVVVCMQPAPGDPNRDALAAVVRDLSRARDAAGRTLEVVTVPSPGAVRDSDSALMPASYVNFYLGNRRLVVPTYGVAADDAAVAALSAIAARHLPGREVVGLSARAILTGGGAFHCVTRQQPVVP